jgi:NRAMP (natural resistance-associated macrophage protein)-like metal ion transporter
MTRAPFEDEDPKTKRSSDEAKSVKSRQSNSPTPDKGATKKGILQTLGPGLVTGAADDDPSGIATYSQIGAAYGYSMLWSMVLTYPLMAGIQEIAAQIGRVTGHGIAGNLRRFYSPFVLYPCILLMVVANTINLGADIEAMGDAAHLLISGPALLYAALFAVTCLVLEILSPYEKYAKYLKWLCLTLFAYVATAFVIHVPWKTALIATFVPSLHFNMTFATSLLAVLGTTISPYLFFWQAEEEVELEKANPKEFPLKRKPKDAPAQLHRIRVDTFAGMAVSNIIAYLIIVATAATLHAHGITNIQSSTQAAEALRPIAGKFASVIFALGIIGTGMLAVPVFAGSAAYAVGESLKWPVGLNRAPKHAIRFYCIIALATVIGLSLCFLHVDPIKALFWSAVLNGVAAGPIMFLMMLLGANRRVMGNFTLAPYLKWLGWLGTIVMLAAAAALFATWGKS